MLHWHREVRVCAEVPRKVVRKVGGPWGAATGKEFWDDWEHKFCDGWGCCCGLATDSIQGVRACLREVNGWMWMERMCWKDAAVL